MTEYAALIGIDSADQQHDVCLLDCASGKREAAVVKQALEAIEAWAETLRRRYPGQKIAVCLEQSRGPLIYALLKYDFLVLYPITPKTRGPHTARRSRPAGPRTIPVTPPTSPIYSSCTAASSKRGRPTMKRRGRCSTWSNIAAG